MVAVARLYPRWQVRLVYWLRLTLKTMTLQKSVWRRNVAMQVAALSPKYLSSDDIPEEYKEHEKKILIEQLKNDPIKNASKPENIIEKMITRSSC